MAIPEVDRELYVPDEEEAVIEEGSDPLALDEGEEEVPVDAKGEESGESDVDKTKLEDEVEELTKPIEMKTIYITRPLRRRTTTAALMASKEIILQLRQSGLHVERVHTDRAREFNSQQYKAWLAESSLRQSRTAGGDPAGNSTAELGVKWAKGRIRALLRSGGASAKDWPMAASHASTSLWSKAFPSCPVTTPPAASFGCEVWFRAKAYKGTKEKKHEVVGTRWKKGWYRGPAGDVSKGHLILREDGGLTIAKSVKFNVIEPEKDLRDLLPYGTVEDANFDQEEPEVPTKGHQLAEEIEFMAKKHLKEGNFDLKDVLNMYYKLEELGDTDFRIGKKAAVTSWYTGSYVHGGKAGLRRNMTRYPFATKYLVQFAKTYLGAMNFTALGIARNSTLGLHRDSHNYQGSQNAVLPLTSFEGGQLWVMDNEIDDDQGVRKILPNDKVVKGRLIDMKEGNVIKFSPRDWHEVQPWEGERIVMLMYTQRATKLTSQDVEKLTSHGFVVDPESLKEGVSEEKDLGEGVLDHEEVQLRSLQGEDQPPHAFVEIEEDLLFSEHRTPYGESTQITSTSYPQLRKITKKAEVQYTANIEDVLEDCVKKQQPLDVTHTVSLQEVKRNLSSWKASAVKEYANLKDTKKAFTVKKRHELPEGCQIIPCKGVFTAKPNKNEFFRRKTRFVGCGNYIPGGQEDMDLFATGIDATSLRTMLAYTIDRQWSYGTTDIRQAFVLAPWRGQRVALQPPAIAFELGLSEPGDFWLVEMALYGLRQSPALWSEFRDEQLSQAKFKANIDGQEVDLKMVQMITDNQVWKIVRCEGDQEPLGFVMVYIDDLLVNALPQAMEAFYSWVAAKWECDGLDVLQEGHPIRFLGMELHMVDGGIELAQEGFVRELLRAHGHDGSRSMTQGPKETLIMTTEEEEAIINAQPTDLSGREHELKEAQRRVGECLWLSGRTRPDIQYVTALLSARTTRCPEIVNKVGKRLLSYLNETLHYRIRFSQNEPGQDVLKVYTDSSFAPSSGRSHGSACVFLGKNPLVWRSGRQQLVTLSTAESELLEGVEGTVLANSARALLQELEGKIIRLQLHIDNQAALLLLQGSTGSWRTRHLRLRANYVRERINSGDLNVVFEPGLTQRADLGTKPFTKERLRQLMALWNVVDRRQDSTATVRTIKTQQTWFSKLLMFCQPCGAIAQKEQIQAEVPSDLYVIVLVLAVVVIFCWEGMKHCWKGKDVRLRALRARTSFGKMTRAELKELQRLLALEPNDLTDEQVDLPSVLLGLGLGLLHPLWEELATSQPFLPFGSITKVVQRRHINVGEMRAAIKAEEKLARVHQDVRYVHLQDSQVSLAALNRELQRSLGVYLSSGLRPGYGYLQSKLNPSDDPSSTVTWARWTPSWTLLTLVLLLCGAFPTRPKSHNPLELLDFRLPAPNWAPHSRLRAPPVSFPCPRPRLQ
eukprot:s4000_g6.t3